MVRGNGLIAAAETCLSNEHYKITDCRPEVAWGLCLQVLLVCCSLARALAVGPAIVEFQAQSGNWGHTMMQRFLAHIVARVVDRKSVQRRRGYCIPCLAELHKNPKKDLLMGNTYTI